MTDKEERQSTNIQRVDDALGGGLIPGTLTMVIGATGVGKTQFGIHWCLQSQSKSPAAFAVVDLSSRGDSQNHHGYARSLAGMELSTVDEFNLAADQLFSRAPNRLPEVLALMGYDGSRQLRSQMEPEQWDQWQSNQNRQLPDLYHFIYGHLIRGTRRFLVDGIDPVSDDRDSLQMEVCESIYHKMIRREYDWLAREVLRQDFRKNADNVERFQYDCDEATLVVSVTTPETMLDQLIERNWSDGNLAAGANTIILMGRTKKEGQFGRGMFVAKHRGSRCSDSILPFTIEDTGLKF